jgi:hypothetical protein
MKGARLWTKAGEVSTATSEASEARGERLVNEVNETAEDER